MGRNDKNKISKIKNINLKFFIFYFLDSFVPELPEVETIVRGLNKTVKGLKITDTWFDWKKLIKEPKPELFKKQLKGRKILRAERRAKYILIDLSGDKTLVIHQKISGHLLYGKWQQEGKEWKSTLVGPLKNDPRNGFIRFILFLNNGKMLALSDLRRFAKILLLDKDKVEELKDSKALGPEPLNKSFNFEKFKDIFSRKKGKIKTVLMDQTVIAGIGNIYSDEILWHAGIHPLHQVSSLKEKELKEIFKAIKKVLLLAIKKQGDSMQDFRLLSGGMGHYQEIQKAYQMTGEKCGKKDRGVIKRLKIGGRSAHFCPKHQC